MITNLESILFFQCLQQRSRKGKRQVLDIIDGKARAATRPRVTADKQCRWRIPSRSHLWPHSLPPFFRIQSGIVEITDCGTVIVQPKLTERNLRGIIPELKPLVCEIVCLEVSPCTDSSPQHSDVGVPRPETQRSKGSHPSSGWSVVGGVEVVKLDSEETGCERPR